MSLGVDRTQDLRRAVEATGYYPAVVVSSVLSTVAGEAVEAYLVHHEPTIDERDEICRHVTVLVLTPTRLILAHTDEHAPDDLLPAPYTSSTTEAVMLSSVRTVAVTRLVAHPERYSGEGESEAVLTIGWGAVGRLDIEPAVCSDPHCDADHGYTGMLAGDDFSLRLSAAAEGQAAVQNLLAFADSLSARTVTAAR